MGESNKNTESSGNSSLELHYADFGIFGASQTPSLVSAPKIPKSYESQIENPSVVDSTQSVESSKKQSARSANPRKSFCYFWLSPKVESPLPLNSNLPNNAQISELPKDDAQNPKFRSVIVGASGLSLGISIVVAILLGIGAGVLMQKIFETFWVLFLGVFWGIAAAVLNVYKVYKAELRDFETLANDPKYKNMNPK